MTRLGAPYGRAIDRACPISFTFEGKSYTGYAGDTLASALLANGVSILARSFKYRRPRGIMGYGDLDAHALVQMGDQPNVAADRLYLCEGLPTIVGQNRAVSIDRDFGAWPQFLKRFMPVGFYYRTLFSALGAWKLFEPFIRQRAGLGAIDLQTVHNPTLKQHLFCDVAVVGAGPAGLAAARQAAEAGAEVLLIEARERVGGFSNAVADGTFDHVSADLANIRVLTGAIAQGLFEDGLLAVEAASAYYKVRAKSVVLATGLAEQPMVFRGNDMPGVMLASAARKLLWLHGVIPGQRIVVATVNDHGLETALDLAEAGARVMCVADARGAERRNSLHEQLEKKGVPLRFAAMPYEAAPEHGAFYFGGRLGGVRFATGEDFVAADTLLMAGGYVPMAALACHAGAGLRYDEQINSFVLQGLPPDVFAAGSLNHIHDSEAVIADGANAGAQAARAAGLDAMHIKQTRQPEAGFNHPWPITRHEKGGAFVEFDEDLTVKDIENAVADGFSHPEHLKRWSTANMGPSQGRHSTLNVLRVLAKARGISPADIGVTTQRPPTIGERFDRLAGTMPHPIRETAMESRHAALGARMMVAGSWHRPAYYGDGRARDDAIRAEAHAVRNGVGLIDVSTLGKIELRGPDCAAFLDRVYATPHLKQPVGKSRYAVLCDEAGAIVDDGVACRFAEDRFYVTTTTGQADATYRTLTWLNAQWRMNVDIAQVTGAFAAVNLAGPRARAVLEKASAGVDLSTDAFPYLAVRMGEVAGLRARFIRVGFTGELGYEIHVAAKDGAILWDALMAAGQDEGIMPFGVEAQRVLRLEKGHIIIGQDTDGLTTPEEAGLGRAIGKTKVAYRGRAAHRARPGAERLLAGFKVAGTNVPPPENCLIIEDGAIIGRVTSAEWSQAAQGVVGLAFLPPQRTAPGQTFSIRLPSGDLVSGEIMALPFYDAPGARQTL